ncbi:TetR/AcrR family transcriptional regulator [Corallococcus terminator]|uniref:TetR/AcrR family transcriptional regulator n=1 Tax=Corallococcus terminator TaxID=2316733 RepID=A0A3A8IWZ7_9BACT|nr:TetR/AcrR family transcriptional regulator [Corallococcus terminator]RKG84384.1 TetR/AcrR family transcriptional regulator [Corallococcus terminator]
MRVSREQAAENHERILQGAGELFRQHGFEGIGVAELMKHAGLTHGGFYGHFTSKQDVMAQACTQALSDSARQWEEMLAEQAPEEALAHIVGMYLRPEHRDHAEAGCAFAALATEGARQGPEVRRAFTEGLREQAGLLAHAAPGNTEEARRSRALATLAGMVGALVLSRVVDDDALSRELLTATATALGAAPSPRGRATAKGRARRKTGARDGK